MIEEILPPGVASAEAFDDEADPGLFPQERAFISHAVEARRREFGTVRRCARLALAELGVPPAPLVPGEGRAPRWPVTVVGSMTHCVNYRAAAVACASVARAIGIDAEPNEPLPGGIVDLIALPGERRWLAGLGARGGVAWDRLLFSCKETVYKASFPLSRRWLGFEDVAVRAGPGSPAFTATILARAPVLDGRELTRLSGRWMARDGLLLTAVTVPHGRPERA